MKINKDEIIRLAEQYDDIIIEEFFENSVTLTCDLKVINETICRITLEGGIYNFIRQLDKYNNITWFHQETHGNYDDDEYPYYEYVTFEWN